MTPGCLGTLYPGQWLPKCKLDQRARSGFAVSPSESRTEGGRRQESDESITHKVIRRGLSSGGGAGFLPSPPLYGDSGAGKIGLPEQPGEPTHTIAGSSWRNTAYMKVLQFITAIPWDVRRGSGCYVGTRTLAVALRRPGIRVEMIRPGIVTPVYTATRLLFNESLRWRRFNSAATVGIDADGYAIPHRRNSPPHIACIKGVLGDAVRFETGATRASLALQAV